jgi:hypothetical protein
MTSSLPVSGLKITSVVMAAIRSAQADAKRRYREKVSESLTAR